MNDNVSVEAGKVSIPRDVAWGVMVRIVEVHRLLKNSSNIAEVRRPVDRLLNAAATELSGALMPDFDGLMDEAGLSAENKSPMPGAP